ncbi:MAG: hypothetical protein Q9186_007414 [Xanthomendoza sp. 1 TL-2023]
MLGFSTLPCLILLSCSFSPGLSNPISNPLERSHFTIKVNPINTTQLGNKPDFLFNLTLIIPIQPVNPAGATQCINNAIAEARTHRPAQLVPQAGFRILRGGVWLSAYPLAEKYTWRLLLLTLRNLRDTLEHETSVGYVACNWVLSEASDDESGAETIYARGSMWPDPNPGHQLLSLSGLRSNTTSQSIISTPYDDFEFDLKYDNPARPLDANAAEGAFGLAFAEESSHELDEAVPRQDHRIEKDDVVLEIQPMDDGYTWGMFYNTIKQVQSILRAKGYLSCSWEISKFEEGKKGKTYGTGILWSTAVDGEENKTGFTETA